MLSAFDQLRDRNLYGNKAYNSDKFREMQPKELSHGRKGKLNFDARNISYWEEYFSKFDNSVNGSLSSTRQQPN